MWRERGRGRREGREGERGEGRKEITNLQELVQLFLIFHYSNVGLTVTSNVLTYFSTVGTVQTSWNTSIYQQRESVRGQ